MPYTDTGTLIIRTYTAGGAVPVGETVIRISGSDEENRFVEYTLMTDVDGMTPRITLPSPNKSYSLSPGATQNPYAQYNLVISRDGYYTKRINNVALFSGIDTFMPVNMIPIAVYENGVEYPMNSLDSTVTENPYL